MAQKLIGQNYTTPDLVAKVTGQAKYAEDYRVDGMLFCKLLLSPYPHARVKRIDATRALAMAGVKGILTADDLPAPAKKIAPLAADGQQFDFFFAVLLEKGRRRFQQISIEGAAQAFIGGNQNDQIALVRARVQQRMMKVLRCLLG